VSVSLLKKNLIPTCILIAMVGYLSSVWAVEPAGIEEIGIIGSADIYKKNVAAARNQAIASGLTSAVDAVVMKLLPKDTAVNEFKSINDVLFDSTNEFIQDYKVLGESVSGKKYRVIIQVSVLADKLRDRFANAGIVVIETVLPTVLFLLAEQKIEDIFPRYWWGEDPMFIPTVVETAISAAFEEKQFKIIPHAVILSMDEGEASERGVDLSNQQAIDIGNHMEAEVVIVGKAWADQIPNTMGGDVNSYKGFVQVRAIRTDTWEVIADLNNSFVTTGSDETKGERDAIEGAASLAGSELASKIMGNWKKVVQPIEGMVLLVEGTKNLGNFVTFRRAVKEIDGVKSIQLTEIKADEAALKVYFEGPSKALAKAMMLKPFENFGIHISEVTQDQIKVKIVSN
jgi:hypothetical protein